MGAGQHVVGQGLPSTFANQTLFVNQRYLLKTFSYRLTYTRLALARGILVCPLFESYEKNERKKREERAKVNVSNVSVHTPEPIIWEKAAKMDKSARLV